jgi:membrane fusion protein (multidrug efflux system)
MRWNKKLLTVVAASTLVLGGIFGAIAAREHFTAAYFANLPEPVVPVTAAPVQREQWERRVAAVGVLEAPQGVDVSPSLPGTVQQVLFESGQAVAAGAPLLRLDADMERAELRSAEAQLALARTEAQRATSLGRIQAIARASVDQAQAAVQVRAAEVERLRAQIDKKTVAAPFAGVLGIRQVDVGQYLEAGTAVVNLQNLSAMLVNFNVSQKHLPALAVGQTLLMGTDAYPERIFQGRLTSIAPQVDPQSGMVSLQGRFDNADRALRPGLFGKLEIVLPQPDSVLSVPNTAISYSLYGNAVYVLSRGDDEITRVKRVPVTTGVRRGEAIAITAGLSDDAEVVTVGLLRLSDGARVEVRSQAALVAPTELPRE